MIRPGDRVKIVRKIEHWQTGEHTYNGWVDSMDTYLNDGKTYTVDSINRWGVHLKEDSAQWGWPENCFQKMPRRRRDWIAVSDRKPPRERPFLGVVEGRVRVCKWVIGYCFADQGPQSYEPCSPTHWMDLPELPDAG